MNPINSICMVIARFPHTNLSVDLFLRNNYFFITHILLLSFFFFFCFQGVQVTLKMAQMYPKRINKMILLNGGDGGILKSGFQVFFDIPGVQSILHGCLYLLEHSHAYDVVEFLLKWPTFVRMGLVLFSRLYEKYLTRPFDQNQVVW